MISGQASLPICCVATVAVPKLESLVMEDAYKNGSSAILYSISSFCQLKSLELRDFRWPGDYGYGELQHLSGLSSLEVGAFNQGVIRAM